MANSLRVLHPQRNPAERPATEVEGERVGRIENEARGYYRQAFLSSPPQLDQVSAKGQIEIAERVHCFRANPPINFVINMNRIKI